MVRQIVHAFPAGRGDERVELQLDPAELGRIEIRFEFSDDALKAVISAERPGTADALRRHAELLLANLRDAGFGSVDLAFDSHRNTHSGGGHGAGGRAGAERDQASDAPPAGEPIVRTHASFQHMRLGEDQTLNLMV